MVRHLDRRSHCRDCGFDSANVNPADAAVAVRSYARRWRELFRRVADDEAAGEVMLHWQLASGWRPVDRVRRLVHVFDRLATQLELVWAKDDPYLDALGDVPAAVPSGSEDALCELDRATERLAEVIDRYEGDQWCRVGDRIGGPVTALQIAREAVHEGSHQLRACRRDLEKACERMLDDEPEIDAA